jgi:outer membrane lipoprotein-sorting protein
MLTSRKALLSCSAAALLFAATCASNQKVATETNANDTVVSSIPPFQTEEPERYRATRTITTTNAAGETVVTKNLIARDGELRRDESETNGQRVVYLTLPEGTFVLLPDEKLFASANNTQAGNNEQDSETSPDLLLHAESLTTGYQKLGSEAMGGKSLQKYRVVVNNSAGENVSVGETFLWFDEQLRMPVRTESRSPNGARTTSELSNVVLDVDKAVFQIPKDYEKVEFAEIGKRLKNDQNQP